MKKKTMLGIIASVLCLGINIFPFSKTNASANANLLEWQGFNQDGETVTERDFPVMVENETITFDLLNLPTSADYSAGTFDYSNSKVTAEYTLYNPTQNRYKAVVSTPNHYATLKNTGDESNFGVFANGEKIQTVSRYSLIPEDGKLTTSGLPLFSNKFEETAFYTTNTQVTEVIYKINGNKDQLNKLGLTIKWSLNAKEIRAYTLDTPLTKTKEGYKYSVKQVKEDEIKVYFVGRATKIGTEYLLTSTDRKVDIDNFSFEEKRKITYTLKSFVEKLHAESESSLLISDYYNVIISHLERDYKKGDQSTSLFNPHIACSETIMKWDLFEMGVEPGERIKYTVVTPYQVSYKNENYSPVVDVYEYLLSPSKSWDKFGNIDIIINTDYYIVKNEEFEFQKADNGYFISLEKLPKGELSFTLSPTKNPTVNKTNKKGCKSSLSGEIGLVMVLLALALLKKGVVKAHN